MDLAFAVLCWTLAICAALLTIMLIGWVDALTKRAKAQAEIEQATARRMAP